MPQALRQALEKEIRIPKSFGEVEVRADTFNEDDRTVEVCWSTGAAVKRYSWDEGYYMEELQVDAKSIRLERFSAMSLLDTHDNYSMDSRLGTVVPGSVRFQNGQSFLHRQPLPAKRFVRIEVPLRFPFDFDHRFSSASVLNVDC